MNQNPHILVEPFCGMAGLSFFMMRSKPPISWMGNKFGYAHVIADILGLSRHNPPAAYIWGDVGPNVAALACLAGAGGDARDVAGWLVGAGWSTQSKGDLYMGPDRVSKGHELGSTRSVTLDGIGQAAQTLPLPRAAEVAAIIRGWKGEEPRALWTRLKEEGWPSLMPPKGARWGQPIVGRWLGPQRVEEVAGWLVAAGQAYRAGHPETGIATDRVMDQRRPETSWLTADNIGQRIEAIPTRFPLVACYQGTATRLVEQLPERLDNVVAYCDPPYENTTGYKFGGCPRSEVLRMALDLSSRGATVAISEAVRLDRELGEGWHAVQIDGERRGQKRTFSVQQHEWVTLNRPPAMVPGRQQGLFGGGR